MKRITTPLIFFIFLFVLLHACKRKEFDFDKLTTSEWNPNIAVPLVKANFDVYDILARTNDSDLVVIDPNSGFIALVYKGGVFSLDANEVVELPPQNASFQYGLNSQQTIDFNAGFSIQFQETEDLQFNPNFGVRLTEIKFLAGSLNLAINSEFPTDASIEISIPGLSQNGQSFQQTINLNYNGSTPITDNLNIDLTGMTLDLTQNTAGGFNNINIEYDINLNANSSGTLVGNESVDINFGLNNLSFEYARGDFGQQQVALDNDSIDIKIFGDVFGGYFEFTDPTLKLEVVNTFGFPIELDIQNLISINTQTNVTTPILLNGFQNPFIINHPTTLGTSASTNLLLDRNNSNINELTTPSPKILTYDLEGTSNPAGPVPNFDNFITNNSRFFINSELQLPLEGFAYGFYIQDTLEVDLTDDIEEVESVMLRLNFTNGFPVDLDAQLWAVDSNFNYLDTLLVGADVRLVPSGIKNSDGRVTSPTNKITDITIDRNRIPNVFKAKYIIVRADGQTNNGTNPNPDIVKFFDDNKIEFRLGMQVKGRVGF